MSALIRPTPVRRSVAWIDPASYQHPFDRSASAAIDQLAGFEDLARYIFDHALEKQERALTLASCIRVGPDQFAELHDLFQGCVERAGVHPEPELFVRAGGFNAETSGIDRPQVVIETAAVDACTPAELEFILGHELGHILHRHMLHHFVGNHLQALAGLVPVIGPTIAAAARPAILAWSRKAELSADRTGLLVCQDRDAALRVMAKLAGVPFKYMNQLNVEAFLSQADDLEAAGTGLGALLFADAGVRMTHPWLVERAVELARWADGPDYAAVLARAPAWQPDEAMVLAPTSPMACPLCGRQLPPAARSCNGCGAPLRAMDRLGPGPIAAEVALTEQDSTRAPAIPTMPAEPVLDGALPTSALEEGVHTDILELLHRTIGAAQAAHLPPTIGAALRALQVAGARPHLTFVTGSRPRELATLVNLLVGHQAIPPRQELEGAVVVRLGEAWVRSSQATADDEASAVVEGPAPLLEHTTVEALAFPALDRPDEDGAFINALIRSDLAIVALDATQLLARAERQAIRDRIRPLMPGPLMLVVMNFDVVSTAEDRADLARRARKFVAGLPGPDVDLRFVGSGASDDVDLRSLVGDLAVLHRQAHGAGWQAKARGLVQTIADSVPAVDDVPDAATSAPEVLRKLHALLAAEEALARLEARADLRARFADLRSTLPGRLDGVVRPAQTREVHGELAGEAQAIGQVVATTYLRALERGIGLSGPPELAAATSGLEAGGQAHVGTFMANAPLAARSELAHARPKDPKLAALALVGGGLVLASGGALAPMVGGGLALAIAQHQRRSQVASFLDALRHDAATALRGWLEATEAEADRQLDQAAVRVREVLAARLEEVMAAPAQDTPTSAEARSAFLAALAGLHRALAPDPTDLAPKNPTEEAR